MIISCHSISLNSIKSTGKWNLHPWDLHVIPKDLQESFLRIGVIHPPIVIKESEVNFEIVSGFKRFQFIQTSSPQDQIDCMVVEQGASSKYLLDIILTDQSSRSALSLAEKARFVEIACRFYTHEEIVENFLARLELKKRRSLIPKLLEMLQQDESIVRAIHSGSLQEKMVFELIRLPEVDDRLALAALYKNLGMGDGKQKRFFSLLRDLAFREGSSIDAYLKNEEIQAILNHREMNVPQKVHQLGDLLQRHLTPSSSNAELDFIKQVKGLHLPASHSLSHSPSFEKDEITLSIKFKDFSTCKQYLGQKKENPSQ
jgi:hypothetical protein